MAETWKKLAFEDDVVLKALFDAQTVLSATADNTPAALTVNEQNFVGRITGGNVAALTGAQALTILSGQAEAAFSWNSQDVTGIKEVQACQNAVGDGFCARFGTSSSNRFTIYQYNSGPWYSIYNYQAGLADLNIGHSNTKCLFVEGATGNVDVAVHDAATIGLKLGGTLVTASAAELNILDGVTGVTAAELSYIGDVTGLIQAQLDGKAATSHAMSTHSDENTYNISTSGTLGAGNTTLGTIGCNTVTIASGQTMAFADGGSADIIRDEDNMASDDVNALCSQQSIKKYVDDTLNVSIVWRMVNLEAQGDNDPLGGGGADWEISDDTENEDQLGSTAVTESNGIFTFTSTGYWSIRAYGAASNGVAPESQAQLQLKSTDDNDTYNVIAKGAESFEAERWGSMSIEALIKVDNITLDKVKLAVDTAAATTEFLASGTYNLTYIVFTKLAGL